MTMEIVEDLSTAQWFVGSMPRNAAEKLLDLEGDFLVRKSSKDPKELILSVRRNKGYSHARLSDEKVRLVLYNFMCEGNLRKLFL